MFETATQTGKIAAWPIDFRPTIAAALLGVAGTTRFEPALDLDPTATSAEAG